MREQCRVLRVRWVWTTSMDGCKLDADSEYFPTKNSDCKEGNEKLENAQSESKKKKEASQEGRFYFTGPSKLGCRCGPDHPPEWCLFLGERQSKGRASIRPSTSEEPLEPADCRHLGPHFGHQTDTLSFLVEPVEGGGGKWLWRLNVRTGQSSESCKCIVQ